MKQPQTTEEKEAFRKEYGRVINAAVRDAWDTCFKYQQILKWQREDLVQDAWVRINEPESPWFTEYNPSPGHHTEIYRARKFVPWLWECVKNSTIDRLRTGEYTQQLFGVYERDDAPLDERFGENAIDPVTGLLREEYDLSHDSTFCYEDLISDIYSNPMTEAEYADRQRRCTVTDEDREWGRHENAMERMRAADLRNYGEATRAVPLLP